MAEALCDQLFADVLDGELHHPSDADDLFGILEAWEDCVSGTTPRGGGVVEALSSAADAPTPTPAVASGAKRRSPQGGRDDSGGGDYGGVVVQESAKRQRCSPPVVAVETATAPGEGGAAKRTATSHIAVERNRRKQMNEHLAVLRALMPCFYVKRGDQASIIGGVVDYIKELQQLLQSLEAKKQRKAYADCQVLSPRPPPACCSPRPPLPSLKSTPPMSPRSAVPISPRTPPTPSSPYKLCRQPSLPLLPLPLPPPPPNSGYASPAMTPTSQESASSYLPLLDAIAAELCAYTTANKQAGGAVLPEVKVEFSGANLVVKTVSQRAPGQAVKVIAALEARSLEILHAKISTVDDTAVNSFTIKIGIECDLSAEELVQEIQQAFS